MSLLSAGGAEAGGKKGAAAALIRSIGTFSSLTMVSRVLGFTRDVLLARYLGAGLAADCFFVAFKLPNFFRRLFAEGAFNAAFVPMFCGILGDGATAEKRVAARRFAEEALAVLLPVLLLFTAAMQIAMPWAMYGLAPGFTDEPEKYALAVEFTRNTFPYLMMISLVSLLAGVLNGLGRFAAAAAAPILLNLTLIGSLLLFHDSELLAGRSLSRAVAVAGLLQFFWILWAAGRAGMGLRLPRPRLNARVRELGRIMLPAAIGAGAVQVNLMVDIILASFLPEGSLSYLFYADRLNQLPVGVVGVAVGTVLLPTLSRALAKGDGDGARRQQARAIEAAMFLTVPAAVALMVVPGPLIAVLFEHGAFGGAATAATAAALMAYAAGLPAYVLVKVLTPGFYSRKDTKTPLRIALVALTTNAVLNLILMQFFLHVGLAMATAIAAWLNVGLLYLVLRRRGHFRIERALAGRLLRIAAAAALMGPVVWWVAAGVAPLLAGALALQVAAIVLIILSGLVAYGLAARALGLFRFGALGGLLR